jgi:hypothetical protein
VNPAPDKPVAGSENVVNTIPRQLELPLLPQLPTAEYDLPFPNDFDIDCSNVLVAGEVVVDSEDDDDSGNRIKSDVPTKVVAAAAVGHGKNSSAAAANMFASHGKNGKVGNRRPH